MKLNRNWAVVAAIALVGVGLAINRTAKAEQDHIRHHDVILFYLQGGGPEGLQGKGLSSISPGVPITDDDLEHPATVIAQALSEGYNLKVDGLMVTLVR